LYRLELRHVRLDEIQEMGNQAPQPRTIRGDSSLCVCRSLAETPSLWLLPSRRHLNPESLGWGSGTIIDEQFSESERRIVSFVLIDLTAFRRVHDQFGFVPCMFYISIRVVLVPCIYTYKLAENAT
jgi:hypothetical protein